MPYTMIASLLALLIGSTVSALGQTTEPGWWNARWTRRAPLTLAPSGVAVEGIPVIIHGHLLQALAGEEELSVGSLRVIGPQGEVPCQFDECDGTGRVVAAPNHRLDADDELTFQADLPARGETTYWLYWSTRPLPPVSYPSDCRVHEPFGPTETLSDLQFHNRQVFMGLRGPSRGPEPTQASNDTHGAGTLTFLYMYHERLAGGDWGRKFPRGALFWQPGPEIKKWGFPRPIAQGPVRCGASVTLDEGNLPIGGDQTARVRVEHRVWLFDRGAVVLFEEFITPLEPIARLSLEFSCPFSLGPQGEDTVWSSVGGQAASCRPAAEQLTRGLDGLRPFSGVNDAWMARQQPARRFLDATVYVGATRQAEDQQSAGSRGQGQSVVLVAGETVTNIAAGETLYRRFWRIAFSRDGADGLLPAAIPRLFSPDLATAGAVEKGGRS